MENTRNPQVMRGKKLMISVTIDPDQVRDIDELAAQRRASRAQIFREALDAYLAIHAPKPHQSDEPTDVEVSA